MGDATGERVLADLLDGLDNIWELIRARRLGLTSDEALWEPSALAWTVHPTADGGARADPHEAPSDPAPVPTIAWREWHIAVDCLDSYSARLFGTTGTGLTGEQWTTDADEAGELMERAFRVYRDGFARGGPDQLFELLGEDWGPYAESTRLAMAIHAMHEVSHHGAEIALLRDLYAARPLD